MQDNSKYDEGLNTSPPACWEKRVVNEFHLTMLPAPFTLLRHRKGIHDRTARERGE
jgi:hypothetical protein